MIQWCPQCIPERSSNIPGAWTWFVNPTHGKVEIILTWPRSFSCGGTLIILFTYSKHYKEFFSSIRWIQNLTAHPGICRPVFKKEHAQLNGIFRYDFLYRTYNLYETVMSDSHCESVMKRRNNERQWYYCTFADSLSAFTRRLTCLLNQLKTNPRKKNSVMRNSFGHALQDHIRNSCPIKNSFRRWINRMPFWTRCNSNPMYDPGIQLLFQSAVYSPGEDIVTPSQTSPWPP